MPLRNDPAWWAPARFYFAGPKLYAWWRSRGRAPLTVGERATLNFDERQNPLEANIVSTLVAILGSVAIAALAWSGVSSVLLRWLVVVISPALTAAAVVLHILLTALGAVTLRAVGLLRTVPDTSLQSRAQVVILTVEAVALTLSSNRVARVCGLLWLVLVAMNLLAHIPLFFVRKEIDAINERLRQG